MKETRLEEGPHPTSFTELREGCRPATVSVVFVGESPPQGKTFFYLGNSRLFGATKTAFEIAYGCSFAKPETFLRFFQDCGCFLVDLCHEPVNGWLGPERRRVRQNAMADLATRLGQIRPAAIIPVARSIDLHVRCAAADAGLASFVLPSLPFPAFGHQARYITQLADQIRDLRSSGTLAGRVH